MPFDNAQGHELVERLNGEAYLVKRDKGTDTRPGVCAWCWSPSERAYPMKQGEASLKRPGLQVLREALD